MKILFEDHENDIKLIVGIEDNGKLSFYTLPEITEIDLLKEAYQLQSNLDRFIREMEEQKRKDLPWWKRLF